MIIHFIIILAQIIQVGSMKWSINLNSNINIIQISPVEISVNNNCNIKVRDDTVRKCSIIYFLLAQNQDILILSGGWEGNPYDDSQIYNRTDGMLRVSGN